MCGFLPETIQTFLMSMTMTIVYRVVGNNQRGAAGPVEQPHVVRFNIRIEFFRELQNLNVLAMILLWLNLWLTISNLIAIGMNVHSLWCIFSRVGGGLLVVFQ